MTLSLIPSVKTLILHEGFLKEKTLRLSAPVADRRLLSVLRFFSVSGEGTELRILTGEGEGEGYRLSIREDGITVEASGAAGAFYALQTLRQLFCRDRVPCLFIEDGPDFSYRGFYQDVTRGRVPTLASLKTLVDRMAYYKLNSLQLYVEHTFPFEECGDPLRANGCLSGEEIRELDAYCRENFIELIPSVATFGHMYEILQQPPYRHLRVLKDYEEEPNVWHARMAHHTIDPQDPESIGLVKSLIDQTLPFYRTDLFNICCDETFDLLARYPDKAGEMYVGFVERIMAHLRGKGKRIMMWADILLRHPETIEKLPAETVFLNWAYGIPDESKIKKLADLGRRQIVCPGTSAWNRFAENVEKEEKNISLMAEYGRRYGAEGILNTNWGDWGHIAPLELSMYGLAAGAEKAWSVATEFDAAFHGKVNDLLYQRPDGWECLKAVSDMNDLVSWTQFVKNSFFHRAGERERMVFPDRETPERVQALYDGLRERLPEGEEDIYRRSLRLAAEGICAVAELTAKAAGYDLPERIRVAKWLAAYRQNWLRDNKESELRRIEEIFRYYGRTDFSGRA